MMTTEMPVFMCIWKRIPRLKITCDLLTRQRGITPRLYIWNNNIHEADSVDRLIAPYKESLRVNVYHSESNIGSIARFKYAGQIYTGDGYVTFIDDDQEFDENFLATLWKERESAGVAAAYARQILPGMSYWDRGHVKSGEPVNYFGPGGAIIDCSLLAREEIYDIPDQYYLFDDIWISYVLNSILGAPIRKSSAIVTMVDIDNDTWHRQKNQKQAFLEHLRILGWEV